MSDSSTFPLAATIRQEMDQFGLKLPFRRFMELALYHPLHGYYMGARTRLGREGDFVTAPEMTSLFGELLTLEWIRVWEALGKPSVFQVVEGGGGSGRLAGDILRTAKRFPQFNAALHYILLEKSPDFRSEQKKYLQEMLLEEEKVQWLSDPDELADRSIHGVIFSNELLDAFPVHWVEMTTEGLKELAVVSGGEGFETNLIEPVSPLVSNYFESIGVDLAVGYRTEVGLPGCRWVEQMAGKIARGLMVTIDYGYTSREYYAPLRAGGTLVGHRGHHRVDDPLLYPGQMDLTAHVDFSALARSGVAGGLTTYGYTTQAWYLMGVGMLERLEMVLAKEGLDSAKGAELRQAVMRLILPQEMGERFKVLVQGRGMEIGGLLGFRLNNQRDRL
ncbi:MAG: SAM-dependent methyltransferase [Magnetococcales bacterium]|nr:SAM-dependent methyltransferase [Magnetococcales bacterium]